MMIVCALLAVLLSAFCVLVPVPYGLLGPFIVGTIFSGNVHQPNEVVVAIALFAQNFLLLYIPCALCVAIVARDDTAADPNAGL